jgi:transcription-repair coupling factor (superfamily II helicase)
VKHSESFFKQACFELEQKKISSIEGISFEAALYFIQNLQHRACVLSDSVFVDRVAIILQEHIGESVACISNQKPSSLTVLNKYFSTNAISIQRLAAHREKIKTCFIDFSLFQSNLIPEPKGSPFIIKKTVSFENLLEALNLYNFKKTTEPALLPGNFLIRGGVVDLMPFDSNKTYRVSFLEAACKVFYINPLNNIIIKQVESLSLMPKFNNNKRSCKSLLEGSFTIYTYNGKNIALQKNNKKGVCINMEPFDYQSFIKQKPKKPKTINSFFEKGFYNQSETFVPVWFLNQQKKQNKALPSFDVFGSLEVGGTYIHDDFGFCRFVGFETSFDTEKACLRFSDGLVKLDINYMSKLSFVSLSQNHPLSFLNKPGSWSRKKNLIQKQLKEFVDSLLTRYSQRESFVSKPFNIDNEALVGFVQAFPYQDTKDQEKCWEEVLTDLKKPLPMNRLVCGDVGFGKTEIAIRASFASVLNNQQVVVLAPTTILANQLYHCFEKRLSPFGVFVGCLSRLTKNKQYEKTLFLDKKTDILIGTSALLFHQKILSQCGLFVVDEEHRFGVENKEKVFSFSPGVNFLALSATPIPRSMQLSLNKARSLSLIQTPPVDRKPIISSLDSFSIDLVKNIFIKEVARGGQVFFVDNSVNNLKKLFKTFSKELPFISSDIIYGSLSGDVLLKKMGRFVKQKTQILFSTTIVESGIDIGTANTIIINNAHLFGLSQLYQLRGRVGRASTQAFSWFLVPKTKKITKEGLSRLKAIIRYSSLGSGYHIALSDLEIRGGGALFGYKQSGTGSVGFEYYTKALSLVLNNQKQEDSCFVDLFKKPIPDSFLSNEKDRAFYYKQIFSAQNMGDLDKIKNNIVASFGVCVPEIEGLINNRSLSLLGKNKKISRISKKGDVVSVSFSVKKTSSQIDSLVTLILSFFKKNNKECWFLNSHKNLIFQYKNSTKDDYILLSSFINKITFF